MQYYIISKNSCQVKLNGVLLGIADCNPYSFNAKEGALLELYPLINDFSSIQVTLGKENTHNDLAVYEYNGGIILLPFFELKPFFGYKLLFSEEVEGISVCVFLDGQVKIFISSNKGSNLFHLPFLPSAISVKEINESLFLTMQNHLQKNCLVFDVKSLPTLKLSYPIYDVIFNSSSFTLVRKTNFIRSSILTCEYDYNLSVLNKKFAKSRAISSLSPLLIPFAFLEELIENMQIEDFLDISLQPHKQMILEYFGNFSTFIPIIKNNQSRAILLYPKQAKEVCFYQSNGLINDFFFI